MSVPTENGVAYHDGTLHKVPTLAEYSGKESFAYVNPKLVSSIIPDTVTVGHESPGDKKVKGTSILVEGTSIFVPMAPAEVAVLLNLELVG
jgi:hypothetical protein